MSLVCLFSDQRVLLQFFGFYESRVVWYSLSTLNLPKTVMMNWQERKYHAAFHHNIMHGNSFLFKLTGYSSCSVKCEIALWRDRVISVFTSGFCMANTVALSLKLGGMVTYRHTNFILNVFAVFERNASSVGNYFIWQHALLFIHIISRDSRQCSARRC